jgi:hypothetical protein
VQLGKSNFSIAITPILLIPLSKPYQTESYHYYDSWTNTYSYSTHVTIFDANPYFSKEPSIHTKIILNPTLNAIAKLGFSFGSAEAQMGYYFKLGLMISGRLGF